MFNSLNDYYKAHVEYEKINGEQKISLRNKRQALILTNDDVLEKEDGREIQVLWADSYGTLHKAVELADKVRSGGTFRGEDHQLQN